MSISHPYLNFSESTYTNGYVVGTSSYTTNGNGLINKNIKIVEIPSFFNGRKVVEIGCYSFTGTEITSIFISKNIKKIGIYAFVFCFSLYDIRFAADSQLERISGDAFRACSALKKIDLPASLGYIDSTQYSDIFTSSSDLECVSYSGKTDFSSTYIFDDVSPSEVKVSSNYPKSTLKFGFKSITSRDGSNCGVSNLPFSKNALKQKTYSFNVKKVPQVLKIMILVLVS